MTATGKKTSTSLKRRLYLAFRWGTPIVILALIFQRIDLLKLKTIVRQVDPALAVLGLLLFPLLITLGAFRWHVLLAHDQPARVPVRFTQQHYWIGLALGFFAPGSLGWDAYRVVAGGRRFGGYPRNVMVILSEKLMAALACMGLLVCLYPHVPLRTDPRATALLNGVYALLVLSIGGLVAVNLVHRLRSLDRLKAAAERHFLKLQDRILKRLGAGAQAHRVSMRDVFRLLTSPSTFGSALALSLAIQVVNAVKSQLFFRSLGYDLPLVVNLFVGPAIYFIFLLPVSFGSIGIREGVFIVMYGLFGVPPEVALLVSFMGLTGLLFNSLIGGVVMLLPRPQASAAPPGS